MNGVHDMGGMHGFGPVIPEQNEPVWHAPWEARMYALARASMIPGLRQQIERMPAADYLRATYYEKWLYALVENAIRLGLITREEAKTGRADPSSPKAVPQLAADQVEAVMKRGRLSTRDVQRQPVFQIGDAVAHLGLLHWCAIGSGVGASSVVAPDCGFEDRRARGLRTIFIAAVADQRY